MKLLLASDLHCDHEAALSLVQRAPGVDVVVLAGDLANMRRGLAPMFNVLQFIERPTVLVAGNNETTDELRAACEKWPAAHVLHGEAVEIAGVSFFGLGGGIPITPFGDWSYDFSDEDAAKLLAPCPAGGVIVSHSPPHGALDVSSAGKHLGSRALRSAIAKLRPKLVACGHIHASGGQLEMLEETLVVNCGPAGMELTLI